MPKAPSPSFSSSWSLCRGNSNTGLSWAPAGVCSGSSSGVKRPGVKCCSLRSVWKNSPRDALKKKVASEILRLYVLYDCRAGCRIFQYLYTSRVLTYLYDVGCGVEIFLGHRGSCACRDGALQRFRGGRRAWRLLFAGGLLGGGRESGWIGWGPQGLSEAVERLWRVFDFFLETVDAREVCWWKKGAKFIQIILKHISKFWREGGGFNNIKFAM